MLDSNEKKKIEDYIDRIIHELAEDAKHDRTSKMPDKAVIDNLTAATVNRFTPESKMILSSVYNMLMKKTLQKDLYQDAGNKAMFYQADILKELNSHFVFDIPDKIDYEESGREVDKLIAGGAVVVVGVGGALSITLKNWAPVCVAVIIAAIMGVVLKTNTESGKVDNIDEIIDSYLDDVKKSILAWVESVEVFYDDRVNDIEKGMK